MTLPPVCVSTADGFSAKAMSLPGSLADAMRRKNVWSEGCPVALSDLALVVLSHWGFDGARREGKLIVHRHIALLVMNAFADLYALHFPIERMESIEKYDGNDLLSMEANNSSAFNCREVTGKPGVWSKHSYGAAIDINPRQNPYICPKDEPLAAMGWDGEEEKEAFLRRLGYDIPSPIVQFCSQRPDDCLVLPSAEALSGTAQEGPGVFTPGSKEVRAFTDRGFTWGGIWQRLLDGHHFEYDVTRLLQRQP